MPYAFWMTLLSGLFSTVSVPPRTANVTPEAMPASRLTDATSNACPAPASIRMPAKAANLIRQSRRGPSGLVNCYYQENMRQTGIGLAAALAALSVTASVHGTAVDRVSPTFAADVAPIVYNNCATCHRPGQAAPFSLLSYDDVKRRATLIVSATERRYMPPWHATPAPGFPEFRDSRRLADADIATIKAWEI